MIDRKFSTTLTADSHALSGECSVKAMAAKVLGKMLMQFISHLTVMRGSDDPEAVHQARVAWRRFKTGLRLFKPAQYEAESTMPLLTSLQPLLQGLGALRDLDVAVTQTLPQWRRTYIDSGLKTSAAQARRRRDWRQMSQALQRLADEYRCLVRCELGRSPVVATLLALTAWVAGLTAAWPCDESASVPLRRWARRRLAHWHACFKAAIKTGRYSANPERQHRARIMAKRLRYAVDALGFLLPAQRSRLWRQRATQVQTKLGAARDLLQAHALAESVAADEDILAFLQHAADQVGDQSS